MYQYIFFGTRWLYVSHGKYTEIIKHVKLLSVVILTAQTRLFSDLTWVTYLASDFLYIIATPPCGLPRSISLRESTPKYLLTRVYPEVSPYASLPLI